MLQLARSYGPGVAISIFIALLAHYFSAYIPYTGSVMLALLLGALAGNTFMNGEICAPGLKFVEKKVLEAAIVLIGFGLEAIYLQTMGGSIIWILAFMVLAVLALSWGLGKVFKSGSGLSFLLGAGSAICGSSAIAATAPIVDASEEETGLSLGIINVLGVLGLLGLPVLAHALEFSDMQTATLLGGVLQSLGHVVASGYALGDGVGEWATVVKMGRILFMVPLLIALYIIKRSSGASKKAQFPYFIVLFVFAMVIAQTGVFPDQVFASLSDFGGILLTISMAAIGAKIRIKALVKISRQGILQGVVLFAIQILMAVAAVAMFVV